MTDLRVATFDRNSGVCRIGVDEEVKSATVPESGWVWIDISGPLDAGTRTMLEEDLQVPVLALQDASRERHPPKLEILDHYYFLMLREISIADDGEELNVSQLSLFIGENVLITYHALPCVSVDQTMDALVGKEIADSSPHSVAYLVCRKLIDICTPTVLTHEEELGAIEDALFDQTEDATIEVLTRLNRRLRRLRRTLAYQARLFDQLRLDSSARGLSFDRYELNDLYENMDRLSTLCQLNQELAVDLLNTHLSIVSHKLNVVMRILTVVTIIVLPLGLLAGIYGMNFAVMPELSWKYGYFTVLGAMATVAIGLILFFRLKRWL